MGQELAYGMITADARTGWRWHKGSVRDAYFPRCCSTIIERFSKDSDIRADLIYLQEQPSKVGPETTPEYLWCVIWGMLCAGDACIVSRSPCGLGRMLAVFVEVFGTFGVNISQNKTENMCMPIPCAPATQIVFNATGQQYVCMYVWSSHMT